MQGEINHIYMYVLNKRFLRERGMVSNLKMEYWVPKNLEAGKSNEFWALLFYIEPVVFWYSITYNQNLFML